MYISKNKNMLGIYIIIFGFVFFFRGVRKLPRNGLKALPGALFLNNFPWKILERLFLFFFFETLLGTYPLIFFPWKLTPNTIAWDPKHMFFWERITSKHMGGSRNRQTEKIEKQGRR